MSINWSDIGHGVAVVEYTETGRDGPAGLLWRHACPDDPRGPESGGTAAPFAPGRWALLSRDPLTLGGSLLCPVCGLHGFVRDGRWVPA